MIDPKESGTSTATSVATTIRCYVVATGGQCRRPRYRSVADLAQYHLSLADTIIAACAMREAAILVHKDSQFEALTGQLLLEALPYKNSAKSKLLERVSAYHNTNDAMIAWSTFV